MEIKRFNLETDLKNLENNLRKEYLSQSGYEREENSIMLQV